jgi:hypothetical protein
MTEEEIDHVAQELAKIGGTSWYPGRTEGGLLRNVGERYRDRARVAIAALDRFRAGDQTVTTSAATEAGERTAKGSVTFSPGDKLEVGAIVVYRPPGDLRAISCQVTQIEGGRAYLVPVPRPEVGWVVIDSAVPVAETKSGAEG